MGQVDWTPELVRGKTETSFGVRALNPGLIRVNTVSFDVSIGTWLSLSSHTAQGGKAMKLSCLPVSFYRDMTDGEMSIVDWAQIALELGLDAIDLSIILIRNRS